MQSKIKSSQYFFEPGLPAQYFSKYLSNKGYKVKSVLAFTGLSTLLLIENEKLQSDGASRLTVVKGFFGYYMAAKAVSESLRPSMYGYYWYKDLAKSSYDFWYQQFCNEARTLYNLQNELTWVNVYNLNLEEDIPYYEMEYLPEGNLAEYLNSLGDQGYKLNSKQTINFGLDIFRSIYALHKLKVIHRDITPENIMFRNGRLILCDLGCAKHINISEQAKSVTRKEPLLYWPPEFDENYCLAKESADIYSVGTVLYRMLTATLPRYGAPSIRAFNKKISPELERFVLRCIAYKEDKRFNSVQECIKILQNLSV